MKTWDSIGNLLGPQLDISVDLDQLGIARLKDRAPRKHLRTLPIPSIFRNTKMDRCSDFHLMTIATLGPFWGAIGLEPDLMAKAWEIQREYFGVQVDEAWSQVGQLLRDYYDEQHGGRSVKGALVQLGHPAATGS